MRLGFFFQKFKLLSMVLLKLMAPADIIIEVKNPGQAEGSASLSLKWVRLAGTPVGDPPSKKLNGISGNLAEAIKYRSD
jgi:hypothetical protein